MSFFLGGVGFFFFSFSNRMPPDAAVVDLFLSLAVPSLTSSLLSAQALNKMQPRASRGRRLQAAGEEDAV